MLIRAEGKIFCAGGDVGSFRDAGDDVPGLLKRITHSLHAAISRFARMDAPVVAAVGGTAAGAGLSLAAACDIVIAADNAKFTMAYTRIGLIPDGSSTFFLPRIVGAARAMGLAMLGEPLSAETAALWGLILEAVRDETFAGRVEELATTLATKPTRALALTKHAILSGETETLDSQLELEADLQAAAASTEDAR